jgi:filamentous hemagglutinin
VANTFYLEAGHWVVPNEVENSDWTHPVVDSRGNLRAVVDGSGAVHERRQVSATGQVWSVDPATGSLTAGAGSPGVLSAFGPALHTGHHFDPYARWHYAWHRWISPFTYGRFTSHSPLVYPVAELNYEWVRNNPWDWVDLDGLDWWSWSDYIITRGTTNFIVGAADAVSFGIAGYNAETYGISKGIVDYRSGAYFGGAITGSVGMVAGPAVVAYRGAAAARAGGAAAEVASATETAAGVRGAGVAVGETIGAGAAARVGVAEAAGSRAGLIPCPNGPNSVVTLEANAIRFSQSNVRASLPEITSSMKTNGWQGAPIDVVRMADGSLTAIDNTRLAAASLSHTPVQAVIRGFEEVLPASRAGGNLQGATWGQAILNRIRGQKPLWQRLYPNGSPLTSIHPSMPGFTP